ncbi:MAG: tetratricopeptide repeat protein [Gemmatimonadota bacterium]
MIDVPVPADDPTSELRQLLAAGRFREALDCYETRNVKAQTRPEAALLAATAATRVGDLRPAADLAGQALNAFVSRADADGRMRAVNLVGVIAFEHGRPADAEVAFERALALARDLADGQMAARASNNLASVAHLRGDVETALSLYRSALLEYQRLGDRRGTAETWHNLGIAFRDMTAWSDAAGATTEAVRHAEEIGEPTLVAMAALGRAELQMEMGEWQLAQRGIARAAELSSAAQDALGQAEAGRLRAALALRTGDPAGALAEAESAGRTAAEQGVLLLEGECLAIMVAALLQLRRRGAARAYRTRAEEIFKRLGATAHLGRLPGV